MKSHLNLVTLLLCCSLWCCKKNKYPNTVVMNNPVFYFSAQINNSPLKLRAGIDNYYMYSGYRLDSSQVYRLTGAFRQIGCTDCRNTLEININDFKISDPAAPIQIDSSLQLKNYPFLADETKQLYRVAFKTVYNKIPDTFLWNFGDGSTSSEPEPVHFFNKQGEYPVCLTVKGTNSCHNSICNSEIISANPFLVSISADISQGNTIAFKQAATGVAPFTYLWSFGDGTGSSAPDAIHTYKTTGSYRVKLKVWDANHDSSFAAFNAVTQSDLSSCAANYSITSILPVKNPALSHVAITWKDAEGKSYSSGGGKQDADAYFRIVSVENYRDNERGEKGKKIHVKFKCKIYHESTFLLIDAAEAVLAVSYNN